MVGIRRHPSVKMLWATQNRAQALNQTHLNSKRGQAPIPLARSPGTDWWWCTCPALLQPRHHLHTFPSAAASTTDTTSHTRVHHPHSRILLFGGCITVQSDLLCYETSWEWMVCLYLMLYNLIYSGVIIFCEVLSRLTCYLCGVLR